MSFSSIKVMLTCCISTLKTHCLKLDPEWCAFRLKIRLKLQLPSSLHFMDLEAKHPYLQQKQASKNPLRKLQQGCKNEQFHAEIRSVKPRWKRHWKTRKTISII